MIKLLYRLFYCRKGIHHRSGRAAEHDGQNWLSKCKNCGAPLIRNEVCKWVRVYATGGLIQHSPALVTRSPDQNARL